MHPAGLPQTWPGTSHHLPSYSRKKGEQVLQRRGAGRKQNTKKSHQAVAARQQQQHWRAGPAGKDAVGDAAPLDLSGPWGRAQRARPRPAPPPPSSPGLGADLRPGGDGQGRPAEGRTPHGPRGCREQRPEPPLPRASSPSRPRGCVLELGILSSFVLRSRDDSKGVCLAFAAASTPPGSKMRRPNLSAGGWIPHYLKQSSCFSPQMHLATRALPIAAHGCSRASSLCSHYCFCG